MASNAEPRNVDFLLTCHLRRYFLAVVDGREVEHLPHPRVYPKPPAGWGALNCIVLRTSLRHQAAR
jgi:hypothetical protein